MAKRPKISELSTIELYRVALANAANQPEVASTLNEFGYDTTSIATGTKLLTNLTQAYDTNKQEDHETIAVRVELSTKEEVVESAYGMHRKKGKVVFRNDEVVLKQLGLTGSMPRSYVKRIALMKSFYATLDSDKALQAKVARLKISPKDIKDSIAAIADLENTRAIYLKEIGESQDATKAKDDAFAQIDDWMMDFFAVAKIAMEDKPQLLESLGILVRS